MSNKCKYWMILLTLLCVVSLGFSLFRVYPCEVGNETFLGFVLSIVGVIVTLVMGYQIFSVVEFRGELQKQKEENQRVAADNIRLHQVIENQLQKMSKQDARIEESINMNMSFIAYFAGDSTKTSYNALVPMFKALYYALESESGNIEEIFINLQHYIDNLQGQTFGIKTTQAYQGNYVVVESGHPYNLHPVREYINHCISPIQEIEKMIEGHKNFFMIKLEYNRQKTNFYSKIEQICQEPVKTKMDF